MQKLNVAVLRGGPSSEYDVSLITGASIIANLDKDKYTVFDILVDKNGTWHRQGFEKLPAEALYDIDLAILGFHGEYGEDGKVQKILDAIHIPYTGSNAVGSALAMNKILAKEVYKKAGLKIANQVVVESNGDLQNQAQDIFKNFPLPVVVKPHASGSSVGVQVVRDFKALLSALIEASKYSEKVLVEQYIRGREATCGVIDNFRGEDYYALLPVEIIPPKDAGFFSKEVKYNGETKEICPAQFDDEIAKQIQDMAILAHKSLGLRHYSRSDFIVTEKGMVYILETNSLPGLTEQSLFPKSLVAVGSNLAQFLDHLVSISTKK